MKEHSRKYRFLGTGSIWDKDARAVLCHFDRNGVFETDDPDKIRKLIKMRVPFEDGQSDALASAEYTIKMQADYINVLEELCETRRLRLEHLEKQKDVESKPSRDALIAELEVYGLPYLPRAKDDTLANMLADYKEIMQLKQEEIHNGS